MSDTNIISAGIEAHTQQDCELPPSLAVAPTPHQHELLKFHSAPLSSHLLKITVEVSPTVQQTLREQSLELFRANSLDGFDRNLLPITYIHELYGGEIKNKIKYYVLHHLVIDFIMQEVMARKINLANYPRLATIDMRPDDSIVYHFDVSVADPIELKEWKHFSFKSPKRKKYKDLDKQVVSFMENRGNHAKKQQLNIVEPNDWVLFDATMVTSGRKPVLPELPSSFWIYTGQQHVTGHFVSELFNKSAENSFTTNSFGLRNQDSRIENRQYNFMVTIRAIVKGSHFSVDTFKGTFKLKNKVEIHNKLMEIFSYRNDISQRRAIIEEMFHLLLSKHRFEVPKHLVLRRQEDIVQSLVAQPDYHVYKSHDNFSEYIEMLAEKQLKEEVLVDQIAYNEGMKVEFRDAYQYLHLFSNKKLSEFIYFRPTTESMHDLENPINVSTLAQAVWREKTLNFIIHTLTK